VKEREAMDIDLNDEVWAISHIAKYMGQSEKSMYKLVAEDGFPAPLHSQSRNRRWLATEVRKYLFARSTRTLSTNSSKPIMMAEYKIPEPTNYSFKKSKEVVR